MPCGLKRVLGQIDAVGVDLKRLLREEYVGADKLLGARLLRLVETTELVAVEDELVEGIVGGVLVRVILSCLIALVGEVDEVVRVAHTHDHSKHGERESYDEDRYSEHPDLIRVIVDQESGNDKHTADADEWCEVLEVVEELLVFHNVYALSYLI